MPKRKPYRVKVIDPGHVYDLPSLDGVHPQILTFVKRFDPNDPARFPGNENSHPGTTLQAVLRVLIDRIDYLDNQIPHENNSAIRRNLINSLWLLEDRAAQRHGYSFDFTLDDMMNIPMCSCCGHVVCPSLGNASKGH
jgi:hypothetical protein